MIRKIIIFNIAFFLTASLAFADDFINYEKIEKVLSKYNYNKNDLILPKDVINTYKNRTIKFENNFENPVDAFININNLTNRLSKNSTSEMLLEAIQILGKRKPKELTLSTSISTNIMNIELGTNIDSLIDYKSSLILRPYLNLIINSQNMVINDDLQKDNESSKYLREFSEDILNILENKKSNLNKDDLDKHLKIYENTSLFDIAYNLFINLNTQNERLRSLPLEMKKDVKTTIISTKYGKIAIGGMGNDKYEGNFLAILDLGGDDIYNLEQFDSQLAYYTPIRFIVDFDGNDSYSGKDYNIGGAYFGINFIIDCKGNDTYKANNFSIGTGVFGIGIIEDSEGNDKYINNDFGIAASLFGIGIVNDFNGDDYYESANYSQSFSSTMGFSVINDKNGNDIYTNNTKNGEFLQAASVGNYFSGAGGISILLDQSGSDKYDAKFKSQSFASDNSITALKDLDGNDIYNSFLFSQSSSLKSSFSLLYDIKGADRYNLPFCKTSSTQNYSYSLFIDAEGSDFYLECKNNTIQNYASIFIDEIGDDTLKFNDNYKPKEQVYTPTLNRLKLESPNMIRMAELDSTIPKNSLNIESKILYSQYGEDLQNAINELIVDTLMFENITTQITHLSTADKAIFAYHYVKVAKNRNLMLSALEFMSDKSELVVQSTFDALLINQAVSPELLFKIFELNIKASYKSSLINLFSKMTFSQLNNKEFKNIFLSLTRELKMLVYPILADNKAHKSIKGKIKELIKSEKDVDLKKLLQNEK